MSLSDFQKVAGAVPVSGRYVYRDDFDDLSQWNIMTSSANCVVSNSILQISNGDEVRSKQKFLYGLLIVVAKSSVAGSLQFGFSDGGNDYVVWSNNYLRYKSTADPTEGTANAAQTETSYNVYALLWEPDNVTLLATPYTDTTTALGANASYTGTARDTQLDSSSPYCYLGFIRAAALADQPGTLYIDESPDNTIWVLGVRSVAVSANTVAIIEHKPIYRYVRVRYVNGATAQTSFRLWSRVGGVQS